MRFRLGILIGGAVGYVLGAKAGTERYEQIQELWGSVKESDRAQHVADEIRDVASQAADTLEEQATEQVEKVSSMVGGDGDTSNGRIPPA
jgi:membrane protein YqaA with SNARE-associated domain